MQRRDFLIGTTALVTAGLARGAAAQQAVSLEWTAGALGGGWYTQATGIANLLMEANPGIRIRVVPGGGADNPKRVQQGLQQMGFGLDFLSRAAWNGEDPYAGVRHDKLRSLGTGMSPTPYHFIRAEGHNLGLKEALQSRGLKIGLPTRASSEEITFQRVMQFYGTSYDKLRNEGGRVINATYTDLVNAFSDGQIDYLFLALGLPGAAVQEIAQGRRNATLAAFPDDVVQHLQRTFGYSIGIIPAGTYPQLQTADLSTLSMDTILLVSVDMAEDVAFRLARTLITSRDRMIQIHASLAAYNPRTAWRDNAVPLHPGAERAYREAGMMS
jgi:TRAP transporter TAXI family solute receptor